MEWRWRSGAGPHACPYYKELLNILGGEPSYPSIVVHCGLEQNILQRPWPVPETEETEGQVQPPMEEENKQDSGNIILSLKPVPASLDFSQASMEAWEGSSERSNTGRSGSKPDTWQPYQGDLPPAGPLLPGQARSGFAERRAPLAATCSWERRRLAATGPELAMKSVFVTVGTTCFEELIAVVSAPETIQILQSLGYSRLVLQVGGGAAPTPLRTPAFTLEVFRFRESLAEEFQRADLVISHAGAGTCLETLEKGKPLLVVINEKLMNNHQLELARQLYKDEHLFYCTCSTLLESLKSIDLSTLKPFPPGQPEKFAAFLDSITGFE